MSKSMEMEMHITMPDGSVWGVPVKAIARHRAAYYAGEFGNDLERSLEEDTLPMFNDMPSEIADWASNNMDWSDVRVVARLVSPPRMSDRDFQEGWVNGSKTFALPTKA